MTHPAAAPSGAAPAPRQALRLVIVTDAWEPQVNGVVRTLGKMVDGLRAMGHQVEVIATGDYPSVPLPSYAEIRFSVWLRGLNKRIYDFDPDAVHIATEGPLGLAARRYCKRNGVAFTTAYHTQFPDYLARRTHLPALFFWPYIRWFHGAAQRVMVATKSIRDELRSQGRLKLSGKYS